MEFILSSRVMREAIEEAELAARVAVGSVLISGEAGVGKTHLARLVHHWGQASGEPFVVVDCAAVARISGGAARPSRTDWFINVLSKDRGTVFLRGVQHLTTALQGDVLRFLDENARRAAIDRGCALRVISSAPPSLFARVQAGAFNADLYYRLNGVYLPIPPLRDRPEDVEPLLRYFILLAAARQGVASPAFRNEWRAFYEGYGWPGNVRESQDVAEALVAQCAWRDLPSGRLH